MHAGCVFGAGCHRLWINAVGAGVHLEVLLLYIIVFGEWWEMVGREICDGLG